MSSDRLKDARNKLETAVVAMGGNEVGTKSAIDALVIAAQEDMRERAAILSAEYMTSPRTWTASVIAIRALKPRTGADNE